MRWQFTKHYKDIAQTLKGSTARSGIWALADQGFVSAANFFTTFYLARNMSQEEFGIFALGYAIILLISSLQQGIILSPMMVLGAPLEGDQRRRYFSSLCAMQALFGFIASILFLICGLTIREFTAGQILIVVALNLFFYMAQEYFRKGLFTVMEYGKALMNDIICYGGQVTSIILLYDVNRLSWETSFFAVGATSALASVFGVFQFRDKLSSKCTDLNKVLNENWHYGKWLLGSSLATYTSSQVYLFISAYFLGPAAAGVLRAVQNVFGPTHVLLNGFGNFVPQVAAKKFVSQGAGSLKSFLVKVATMLLSLMLVYCVGVSFDGTWILKLLYKEQYPDSSGLVYLFGINYIIATISLVVGFGLRAIRRTDVIFRAYVGSSFVTVFASIPLVYFGGTSGAVLGIILSGTFVSSYSFTGLIKFFKEQ